MIENQTKLNQNILFFLFQCIKLAAENRTKTQEIDDIGNAKELKQNTMNIPQMIKILNSLKKNNVFNKGKEKE